MAFISHITFSPWCSDTMVSVRWQITRMWRRAKQCGVSVSTLSGAASLVYLSSACDYKWSQFDGSSHALHGDISYSSHNAVIDISEPVVLHGDDSTVSISSKHSDMLTEILSLGWQHQYLTLPNTNHTWGNTYNRNILFSPALISTVQPLNTLFTLAL